MNDFSCIVANYCVIYSTYIGKLSLNFGIDDYNANKPFNAMFLSLLHTHTHWVFEWKGMAFQIVWNMFTINKILHANLKSTSKLWLDVLKVGNKIGKGFNKCCQNCWGTWNILFFCCLDYLKGSRKNIHDLFGLFWNIMHAFHMPLL